MDIESEIVQGFDFKNVIDSFSAIMYSPRDFDIIFYRVSQTHGTLLHCQRIEQNYRYQNKS